MDQAECARDELIKLLGLELERSIPVSSKSYSFEHSIRVYLNKPQVVNNWLAGSINVNETVSDHQLDQLVPGFKQFYHFSHLQIKRFLSKSTKIFVDIDYLVMMSPRLVLIYPVNCEPGKKHPSPSFTHMIEYDDSSNLNLFVARDSGCSDYLRQKRWLSQELLVKINNWSLSIGPDPDFKCANQNTLKLYDGMINDYWRLYQKMKSVYWDRFSPIWKETTGTDPEKFIYEDIHIACYLILAWRHVKQDVKCFVDLGCGNGLLAYILNDQGYHGYGIDMRERKIWSNEYFKSLNLKLIESTINPSEDVFENCDWLIGNHSDELSPWLPVMAFKSRSNYFLIPCCMFDFYSKFDSKFANKSRSDSYLEYLEKISQKFGFETFRDKLRIPSTKNACFVGINKDDGMDIESVGEKIESVMGKSNESLEFKPRDLDAEKSRSVRNCTKNVPNDLREFIIGKVVDSLVSNEDGSNSFLKKHNGSEWNCGRSMKLNDVAGLFDKEVLKKLKLECGGIKTLLRNHARLFDVYDKESVRLKLITNIVIKDLDEEKKKLLKTKRCPFDQYHPNGCLLKNEDCYFFHIP